MIRETQFRARLGVWAFVVLLLASVGAAWALGAGINDQSVWRIVPSALVVVTLFVMWFGFFIVQPNKGQVLQLFGDYAGTVREAGLWWAVHRSAGRRAEGRDGEQSSRGALRRAAHDARGERGLALLLSRRLLLG